MYGLIHTLEGERGSSLIILVQVWAGVVEGAMHGSSTASFSPDPLSCLINGLQKLLPLPHQLLAHCLLGSQLLTKLALYTPETHLALHFLSYQLIHIWYLG